MLALNADFVAGWLAVVALFSELPVSTVAIALGTRFPRRRMLLVLVLADLVVVMRYLVYPVLDRAAPESFTIYALSRGLVLLYGVTCIAVCAAWFVRGRRRFGTGDGGTAHARAQLSDPFWPSDGPISRSQLDIVHGCFTWATFGWQILLGWVVALEWAVTYFVVQVVPGTAVVAAVTGLWLMFRVRRDFGVVVLAALALGLGVAIVSSQVVQQAATSALAAGAREPAATGGLLVASLLSKSLTWTVVAALTLGPVLVIRWCCVARLSRETFDPHGDWQTWAAREPGMGAGTTERLEARPEAEETKPPCVATKLTFWWYVGTSVVTLAAFAVANVFALQLLWIEFFNYAKDRGPSTGQFAPVLYFYLLATSYGLLLLVPTILTFPLATFTAWRWKRPPSLLLLRPFHQGRASRALAKVVRRHLASVGHVYSLADGDIHVPWYVTLSTLLGQLSILSFGYREITQPRQLDRLVRSIGKSWFRSVNWAVSWSKVFPISTSDSAWVPVVRTLLGRVDVVVVDVSVWRPNVVRELELCSELAILPRVVCIVRADTLASAKARLEQEERWRTLPLHSYDDSGNAPTLRLGVATPSL
jgi:hypothetical protein